MSSILSVAIGGLIAIMVYLNGALGIKTGNYFSSILIHIAGLVLVSLVILIKKEKNPYHKRAPYGYYLAGAVGALTVVLNNAAFPKLGIAIPVAVGLLGQSITSIVVDHFGWFGIQKVPFQKKKLIGFSIMLVGIVLLMIS